MAFDNDISRLGERERCEKEAIEEYAATGGEIEFPRERASTPSRFEPSLISPRQSSDVRAHSEIEISPRTLRLLNEENAQVYVKTKGGGRRVGSKRNVQFE